MMKRLALCTAALVATAATSCGSRDAVAPSQLLLGIETDAPVPRSGLTTEDLVLFDRLRITLWRDGEASPCGGCLREFALSGEDYQDTLSVGIARQEIAAVAHVELYAQRNTLDDGSPDAATTLSKWIRIPRPDDNETQSVVVRLTMDALGTDATSREAPAAAINGVPALLPRWPEARSSPCAGTPGPDEACVPGGTVWMGNALRRPGPAGGIAPRLVKVSPFFVDLHEVTVADMRRSALTANASLEDLERDAARYRLCTYSATPGERDVVPVTCVSQPLARSYCQSLGKDLPTEAQLEYLGGGLRGATYPWGEDDPKCLQVVFGNDIANLGPCVELGFPEGARKIGWGARDVLFIGDRRVIDLAGNVSEWARDPYRLPEDECNRPGFFVDPVCDGAGTTFVARGGAWLGTPLALHSEARYPVTVSTFSELVGFRCSRPMR